MKFNFDSVPWFDINWFFYMNPPISKSFPYIYDAITISSIMDVCCVSLLIFWIEFSIWLHIIVDCGLDLIVLRYYQVYWILVISFLLGIVPNFDVITFNFSLKPHLFYIIILSLPTCFVKTVKALRNFWFRQFNWMNKLFVAGLKVNYYLI